MQILLLIEIIPSPSKKKGDIAYNHKYNGFHEEHQKSEVHSNVKIAQVEINKESARTRDHVSDLLLATTEATRLVVSSGRDLAD